MKRALLSILTPILLAFVIFSPVSLSQNENQSAVLRSLVEAERAFARTSVEKGIRDSFYEFFAEDGINFQPHPTNTRESIRKSPAPTAPSPAILNWEPVFADVSRAGDLGYTTGPYWVTDRTPERKQLRQGYYFSIWKKQADGNWKVVIDAGVPTPPEPTASQIAGFQAARPSAFQQKSSKVDLEAERAALINVEREFLRASKADGIMRTFPGFMSDDARLHRTDMLPLTTREAIRAFFAERPMTINWEPIKADVSRSNDLGYTYGSYELKAEGASSASVEKGYFVRVWKRNKDGKWKVVLDTTNPLPSEQK